MVSVVGDPAPRLALLADYWTPVWRGGGPPELIAQGFERLAPVTTDGGWEAAELAGAAPGEPRGPELAQAGERGLRARLANAQAAVTALNARRRGQRRGPDPPALREAVDAMRARYRVQDLRHVRYTERFWERPRRYPLTPLSRVHRRILALLDFSVDIYTRLSVDSDNPP